MLRDKPMLVKDSHVAQGSLWNLEGEVLLYSSILEDPRGDFEGSRIERCIIVVIDVVGLRFKFGAHSWVHVLTPVGTGYINRVHFNSDGAARMCI